MNTLVIGITGINASDNPAPGIGVAKSLKQAGDLDAYIVGLAYDAMEPGIYMDWYIDKAFMIPYPTAGCEALLARLLYIKQSNGLDVVVPTLDSEIPFYLRIRDRLTAHGIHTFLPTEEQFHLRDKQCLKAVGHYAGVETPEQIIVTTADELIAAGQRLGFPIMVKGDMYGAYRADTMSDALTGFSRVLAEWGGPVILQKVVQGTEMNLIGVGDGDGGAPGMVAIKKVSTTKLGKIWTGVTVDHPLMIKAARRFVEATHWCGAFELECIVNGGRVFLIEVNPRFPAWVYFATGVGVNLPLILVRRAIGEVVDFCHDYQPGRLYVRYTNERVCDMSRFQNMVTRGES